MALNRSHLAAIATAARALLLFGLLVAVAPTYGVVGVAYAVAGLNGAMVAVDYAMSSRLLKIDTRRFLEAVWRPATASIAMCIAVWLFRESVPAPIDLSQHAWRLARSGLLGGLVYVVCVLGLWMVTGRGGGAERRLFALLKGYFPKR
jgi:O-antigen/teichoic acid export membrane protein